MLLTVCPEPSCGALAEVTARYPAPAHSGVIEHVKVLCLHRHWFVMPVDRLPVPPH